MKLLILRVPVINFDRIILLSFVPKTLIFPGNVRQIKLNHVVLIYNNDSAGIASFLTDMYFSIIQ